MTDINHSYPFDPTGTKGSNRIPGEKHALSPPAWKDYFYIIPKLAPFFSGTLKIHHVATGRELIEGVDWQASHRFLDASRATARPVYGSITFYDKTLSGVVEIDYQTLGGDWTIDDDLILELLVNKSTNPRITTWEEIVDVPYQFPVIDHAYHLDDLVGMSDVKESIDAVAQTILNTRDVRPAFQAHSRNTDNPHEVTKAQVGLESVENFPPSTRAQALDGVHDESYMTPRRVRQSIEKYGHRYTDTHEKKNDNPHEVTKAQVGLGDVQNLKLASTSQAEEGDSHDSYMTPVRTKEAITAQVRNAFSLHVKNTNNPHEVSKTDVGLGSVQNYPPSSENEALLGERLDRYMTPKRTRQAIVRFGHNYTDQEVGKLAETIASMQKEIDALRSTTALATHEIVNNPHDVDVADIGLTNVSNEMPLTLGDIDQTN